MASRTNEDGSGIEAGWTWIEPPLVVKGIAFPSASDSPVPMETKLIGTVPAGAFGLML